MAQFGSAGALGALGRRFESCRPDSPNPSNRQVPKPVFFVSQVSNNMQIELGVELKTN